jgi:hypothetical protein
VVGRHARSPVRARLWLPWTTAAPQVVCGPATLHRLLALPGLHATQPPSVRWNDLADAYELRTFTLAVDDGTGTA